jgi:beta-xylosidase
MKILNIIFGLLLFVCLTSQATDNNISSNNAITGLTSEMATDPSRIYNFVETFVNPVLPGDHPDPSLLKVGNDYYASGSCFHFNPFSPIYHSTDLIHWEIITRVVPSNWSGLGGSNPGAGIWGGTLSYFYNSYWFYFSNTAGGGQYFCKASNPKGPWTSPVKVITTADTGPIGYDNSIFVDDDGTPYMLIKPGQFVNRIQQIGTNGHLTGKVIKLDWVNTNKKYSWAEGPVMCKRNGWYYYFIAGNVAGGQYVLRSRTLTSDSLSWEAMGNFFENVTDGNVMFRSPNHITQPFMLEDSTWWTISHSYENLNGDSWDGKGRQGLLHQIIWNSNGKPTGKAPTTSPLAKPVLENNNLIPWKLPRSDEFDNQILNLCWHFLNPSTAIKNSLKSRAGWLTLVPGNDSCHILQKDAGHYYSFITKVNVNAVKNGQAAGLYITNGNMSKSAKLSSIFKESKKISFSFLSNYYETPNTVGDTVWLKIERKEHILTGYFSGDGLSWMQVGSSINVSELDKGQDNYNSWVGNSQGLFAKGVTAFFDFYSYRDGFSKLALVGRENYYGIQTVSKSVGKTITNVSSLGGWFMLGGVQIGNSGKKANRVEVSASSISGGILEIWIDDLDNRGIKLAEIEISSTGSTEVFKTFEAGIPDISGQHDLYFRFKGGKNAFYLNTVQFKPENINSIKSISELDFSVYPNPSSGCFNYTSNLLYKKLKYEIFDMMGKSMEKGFMNASGTLGQNLKKGLYLLKFNNDKTLPAIKLIRN